LSGRLNILLVPSDPGRARILEQRLGAIGGVTIVEIVELAARGSLYDTVVATAPDVMVVDIVPPARDRLDELRRIGADHPLPIALLVDRDDPSLMAEAIAAGVCSYTVVTAVTATFPEVTSIVMAAIAMFHRQRQMASDLRQAAGALAEREVIARAKALLMRERNIDEPRAYRWLRRRAMNESRRIAAVAADLLAGTTRDTRKP
jgi:two-component system, response regulator / RNA-binding antiterminator